MTKIIFARHHFQLAYFSWIVGHDSINIKYRHAVQQDKWIILEERFVGSVKSQKVEFVFSPPDHNTGHVFAHDFLHSWEPVEVVEVISFIRLPVKGGAVLHRIGRQNNYLPSAKSVLDLHIAVAVNQPLF